MHVCLHVKSQLTALICCMQSCVCVQSVCVLSVLSVGFTGARPELLRAVNERVGRVIS